jgi:TPR repeat protein
LRSPGQDATSADFAEQNQVIGQIQPQVRREFRARPALAQNCLRKPAELGHGCAQQTLGCYLSEGLAGEHNEAEARMWLEKAADQGVPEAQ